MMMHQAWPWIRPVLILLALISLVYAVFNFGSVKRVLVGRPMRSREIDSSHSKLFWLIALPVLSADLYSSVAYGPEAGITELAHLGVQAKWLIIPVTGATVILLGILITTYVMGVIAYPNGGGAYAIAKDNFKSPLMSLIAASSLSIDYVLTVAVSISSGVQAMASAYPALVPHETTLAILCLIIILVVNLRGVAESAAIFAWPTFIFMICMLCMLVAGFMDESQHGFEQGMTPSFGIFPHGLTTLLLLKAFSSACSAVTGLETISNAVPIFRDAKKGAIKAYIALGAITGVTLLGFAYHLYVKGISVDANNTMLSQLAQSYFGHNILYQIIIWSTFIVLLMAANSTFTGFSQLAALIANDGFLPRALRLRGDRLGYSNGMIVLAAMSALLIEVFDAQTNALIPLYAIGVFVAFTVAGIGLTRRWFHVRGPHWRLKAAVNAFGFVVTTLVAITFAVTKFSDGAWIVLIALPMMVPIAIAIHKHYEQVAKELRIDLPTMQPGNPHHVVSIVLISGVHRVVLNTIEFARSLNTDLIAVYIGFDDESIEKMDRKWEEWGSPCRLVTIKSEYRSLLIPLSRLIQRIQAREGGKPDHIQIMIAQFVPKKWWHYLLHNQTSLVLRAWMIRHKDIIITTVPYHLRG